MHFPMIPKIRKVNVVLTQKLRFLFIADFVCPLFNYMYVAPHFSFYFTLSKLGCHYLLVSCEFFFFFFFCDHHLVSR